MSKFEKQYAILGIRPIADEVAPTEKAMTIFMAACKKLGIDPASLVDMQGLPAKYLAAHNAFYKLMIIRDALNESKEANWNDSKYKYGPRFWMNQPGFRLYDVNYVYAHSYTTTGSRLCSFEEETTEFFAVECIAFWADFMGGKLPE